MVENTVLKSCIPTIVSSITSRWQRIPSFLTPSNNVAVCAAMCLRLILSNWPSTVVLASSKDIITGLAVPLLSRLHSRKASSATPARCAPSRATPTPSARPPTPPSPASPSPPPPYPQSPHLSSSTHAGEACLALRASPLPSSLLEFAHHITVPAPAASLAHSPSLQARGLRSLRSRRQTPIARRLQTHARLPVHSRGENTVPHCVEISPPQPTRSRGESTISRLLQASPLRMLHSRGESTISRHFQVSSPQPTRSCGESTISRHFQASSPQSTRSCGESAALHVDAPAQARRLRRLHTLLALLCAHGSRRERQHRSLRCRSEPAKPAQPTAILDRAVRVAGGVRDGGEGDDLPVHPVAAVRAAPAAGLLRQRGQRGGVRIVPRERGEHRGEASAERGRVLGAAEAVRPLTSLLNKHASIHDCGNHGICPDYRRGYITCCGGRCTACSCCGSGSRGGCTTGCTAGLSTTHHVPRAHPPCRAHTASCSGCTTGSATATWTGCRTGCRTATWSR